MPKAKQSHPFDFGRSLPVISQLREYPLPPPGGGSVWSMTVLFQFLENKTKPDEIALCYPQ